MAAQFSIICVNHHSVIILVLDIQAVSKSFGNKL